MQESLVFTNALKLATAADRAAYLDEVCSGNAELRAGVEALLQAHAGEPDFLEQPAGPVQGILERQLGDTFEVSPVEQPGMLIGPYKLLEQIGEGGFGVVFMAEQSQPMRRKVALKVLKPGMDSRQIVTRFEAERQALAIMDHPNIAKVLDGGATSTGRPYFVMELVRGVPITTYCDQHQLTPRQRLELFVPVCQAVHHAHQKGIIHRDLKPSNIMVTKHNLAPAPKVIDFGVAKALGQELTDKTLFTGFAQLIGTPLYMSPEQAGQSGLDIDTRSDIYSLGVLLYELLTGSTPFDKERFKRMVYDEICRVIREEDPPIPSTRLMASVNSEITVSTQRHTEPAKLTRLVRGELDWIVMKALEKDRNRRYESANALALDVQRYLNDEPVLACPPSAWYRLTKTARRHRAAFSIVAAIGLATVLVMAALATSTILIAHWHRITAKALVNETDAKNELETTLKREQQDFYFHRVAAALRELSVNNLRRALQLLEECPRELRDWEWNCLIRLCREDPVILRNPAEVHSVAFDRSGRRLAAGGSNGVVNIWNMATSQVDQTIDVYGELVVSVALHPSQPLLATSSVGGQGGTVRVWDLATKQIVFEKPCDAVHSTGTGHSIAFSPDGRKLAFGSNGSVDVWDWNDPQLPLHRFPGHDMRRPISVTFSSDGKRLASGSWSGSVRLWDLDSANQQPLRTFGETGASRHPIAAVAFSADGKQLATASFGRRVDVWDTNTGRLLHNLPHDGLALSVAFSPDGRRLASTGKDKTVRIWDARTGREVLVLRGHKAACGSLAYCPTGSRLVSASLDHSIYVWDATRLHDRKGQELFELTEHADEIWSLAVSPDNRHVVTGGWSMPTNVWRLPDRRPVHQLSLHPDVVFCLAWHPDRQQFASAGRHGGEFTVKVYDLHTKSEAFQLSTPSGPEFFAVAYSTDGRYLVTGRADGTVQVWDANHGRPVGSGTLGTHKNKDVRAVVMSPNGQLFATASGDGEVMLWNVSDLDKFSELGSGEKLPHPRDTFRASVPGQSLNIAFSPDGRRIATGGERFTAQVRDVESGETRPLWGHTGDVYSVAFSPDPGGRWLATAGEDSSVKIWDSETGRLVRSFRGHIGLVSAVAFTSDGKLLISASFDHTIKIWDATQFE